MKLHRVDQICYMCLNHRPSSHFVIVRNSFIIELYETYRKLYRLKVLHKPEVQKESIYQSEDEEPFDQDVDAIPNYFRNVNTSINLRTYLDKKYNEKFLEETHTICMDCYLRGTKKLEKHIEVIMKQSGVGTQECGATKLPNCNEVLGSKDNRYFIRTKGGSHLRIGRGQKHDESKEKRPFLATTASSIQLTTRSSGKNGQPSVLSKMEARRRAAAGGGGTSKDTDKKQQTTFRTDTSIKMRPDFLMESIYGISRSCLRLPDRLKPLKPDNLKL